MPNPQDIFQLAQQTATQVTASPENWRRFLYTAAHNYHTTYLNQLLIHAQRPDATACATMKYWNEQAHRKVMYGSKSIIILQRHQGVPTAKRVFSMTDTVLTGDKAAAPWEVTDAIRPLLMQVNSVGSLMDRATEQVVSLSDRANRVLATSIEDSALNWSHPEDQRFILQELAAQSTLYMICIRLGIPVQEEDFPAFQNVTQFDTSRISLCLGGYVQAAAEPLLDELGHEVMQLARDSVAIQAEPVHNTDTQSPTQTTSREEAVTDDVHEREGLSDSEPELAESQENQPEPVRQDAAGLLGAERAEPVRPDDAGGNAAVELPQDGAGCAADGGQDAARSDAESADLRNEDFPLVGRAVSREQFQQLLDANPHNGGMVLSEQQRESLVQEQREQALSYIEDYLKDEFEITEPDFSDLTQIDLGYTTTEDEQHTIKVHADLEHCTISKFVDDTLYAQDTYASLEDMNRMALANLDFDSLMEVDINEIEEQEPEISADEPEKSTFVSQVMQDVDRLAAREEPAEYDRTNYLAPYEPAVPEGPKAKFAANVQAIRTLKEIEQRMASGGAPASEQEQDILAGYLGWGGLADAFDPGKDNWHTEYEQLKALLTEDEYAAARESTLTAFYTPPAVIHAMYRALEHIGCVGGNVLEPSMGVGAFFGHRHSKFDTHNAKLYGVELDSLSGRIAQQLYQKAKIQITGYEKADLPDNFFDLAIGNVPFGQYQVSDRRYDKLHFQIHDYFLAKTVDKLRVGGIMAFITTSGTMDKKSEDVRQYLAARCDLIGAVRLPNTTFKSNAGTEVTSDILFLQKRGRVLEQDAPWIHVGETENGIPLNQYFIDHPEMVCGEMQMVSGPYGMRSACVPNEQSPLAEQLDAALSNLHADYTLVDEQEYAEEESGTIDADPNVRNFSYTVKDDVIYYRENSKMRVVKGGDTTLARIRALVPLRDTCRELIDAQLENFPDEYIQKLQARLNDQYDAYRKKYGLINSRGTASAFREDSGYFLLCSLEDLDDEGNFKGKTDIYNDTAEIISLAAVYYQQDWPRSELVSAFGDNVPFTKFCRALAAYGLDVTARESAPYSCMSYGGCVNGYRSEGEVVSIKDYRLETHTCSEGDDACGQYDAAAEWHWNEGHAENESYTVWKENGTHDVTVFFPVIFPDGATGSELSDLPEEYNAVADGKIKAADCTGNIVLDDSANLYKGELNDWFYTPDELTVTFTVVTGEGDDAVSDDYEVTFSNATAIPWCPGELNDGQYGHYDLDCTIYLTGYDRYTDPETQAPNGADGGTGNLEALAESCDAFAWRGTAL